MPGEKRKHGDSLDHPPPFPTTAHALRSRELRTRSQSRTSANSRSVSISDPDRSRQQSPDVGSLVIESTLAEYREAMDMMDMDMDEGDDQLDADIIEMPPSAPYDAGTGDLEGGRNLDRKRKRTKVAQSDSATDREIGERNHSHPPIAYLNPSPAPSLASTQASNAARESMDRRQFASSSSSSSSARVVHPEPSSVASSSRHPIADPYTYEGTSNANPASTIPPLVSTSTSFHPYPSSFPAHTSPTPSPSPHPPTPPSSKSNPNTIPNSTPSPTKPPLILHVPDLLLPSHPRNSNTLRSCLLWSVFVYGC